MRLLGEQLDVREASVMGPLMHVLARAIERMGMSIRVALHRMRTQARAKRG